MKRSIPAPRSYEEYKSKNKIGNIITQKNILSGFFLIVFSVGLGYEMALNNLSFLESLEKESLKVSILDVKKIQSSVVDRNTEDVSVFYDFLKKEKFRAPVEGHNIINNENGANEKTEETQAEDEISFYQEPSSFFSDYANTLKSSAEKEGKTTLVVDNATSEEEVIQSLEDDTDVIYVLLDSLISGFNAHHSFQGIAGENWFKEVGTIVDEAQPERTDFYIKKVAIKKAEKETIKGITTEKKTLGNNYYLFSALQEVVGSLEKTYKILGLLSHKGFNVDSFRAGDKIRIENNIFILEKSKERRSN